MREKTKDRKFKQTVELQVALKDYDPQKDKRFVGSVRLPNIPRPNLKICVIADQKHTDEIKAGEVKVDVTNMDAIKKFTKKYSLLLATDTLVKKIPVVLGPVLNRIG